MDAEVNVNSNQTPMTLKEKEQDVGRSETNGHRASQPFTTDLDCNVQNNIICEFQLQTQPMRDINCGDDSPFKIDMNFKLLIDTP